MSLIVHSARAVEASRQRHERARRFFEEAHTALLWVVLAAAVNPLIYIGNEREVAMLNLLATTSRVCLRRARRALVQRVLVRRHLVTRYLVGHGRFARLSVELVARIVELAY